MHTKNGLKQESPTSRPWTSTSCQISSGIRLEILKELQCTINAVRLSHAPTLIHWENVFHENCPTCQKSWGPLKGYRCEISKHWEQIEVFFIFLIIFSLLNLSISEQNMIKCPMMTNELSASPWGSVNCCLIHLISWVLSFSCYVFHA